MLPCQALERVDIVRICCPVPSRYTAHKSAHDNRKLVTDSADVSLRYCSESSAKLSEFEVRPFHPPVCRVHHWRQSPKDFLREMAANLEHSSFQLHDFTQRRTSVRGRVQSTWQRIEKKTPEVKVGLSGL